MLFSLGHGQHVIEAPPAATESALSAESTGAAPAVPLQAVVPDAVSASVTGRPLARQLEPVGPGERSGAAPEAAFEDVAAEAAPVQAGKFRYYFPDAPGLPERADMPDLLDALAESMVEANPGAPAGNSGIAPVFTYLGQFIDHDITANTDRETPVSVIEGAITPLPRQEVTDNVVNLRDGSLALDSLYGDATGQHAFAAKLAGLMRFPGNRAKMRLARPSQPEGGRVPFPLPPDDATDLPRLGFLLDRGLVTQAELEALEPDFRRVFLEADGSPIRARAIIGDARNDENLVVAQLHALFLRLHNKLADATGGRSFRRARRLTQWHYQWLVVNSYLRTICDGSVLDEVIDLGAPRYAAFLDAHGNNGPKMPMPLEFSVAAFRFGHSMVRGAYDHNRFFGEEVAGTPGIINPVTPFSLLFAFTGNGRMNGQTDLGQLPSNWVIEWDRWIATDAGRPVRAARKIDTDLAPPLADMTNEGAGVFLHLAKRNLRRSYRLNIPTAQGCMDAVRGAGYKSITPLTPEQLREGSQARADAVVAGGFDTATPLWFYVLKEAEVLGQGQHLGPLGSHIVAETLVGLIVGDPDSYWNADGGRWSPEKFDAANPIDSLEDVVRFCGMM